MDDSKQPKQPSGNWTLNLNFKRKSDPNKPAITGVISTPEHPDREFAYEAYQKTDDEGRTYFIGPVHGRTMRQHLTDKEDNTHFIAIRYNHFKIFAELDDGSPNPEYEDLSAEQRKEEDAKPSFWATWTRTDKEAVLGAHAWDRQGRYGPWASGNTQHRLTKEQLERLKQEGQLSLEDLLHQGAVTKGMPGASKAGANAPDQETRG